MAERVCNEHSLHKEERPERCPNFIHATWRVLMCDGETDVVECSRCGKQRTVACDFDEEFS